MDGNDGVASRTGRERNKREVEVEVEVEEVVGVSERPEKGMGMGIVGRTAWEMRMGRATVRFVGRLLAGLAGPWRSYWVRSPLGIG
jgi:hypothetical protein